MAGIYIHIPFCKQACSYCDFHFSTSLQRRDDMVEAICKELVLRKDYLKDAKLETIYFGGGTPSLLKASELMQIFDTIHKNYEADNVLEVTLEANPDDLTSAYVQSLVNTPIQRLSIGIQSFAETELLLMNRAHNAGEAERAVKTAQDAGLDNISADLIFGTPSSTELVLENNIAKLASMQVQHISAYGLTIEPRTAMSTWVQNGKVLLMSEEQSAVQYATAMQLLPESGYEQYEISNYARERHYALHNTNYWRQHAYLGVGPSAHSYDGDSRQWNVRNNLQYLRSILTEHTIPNEREVLTEKDKINELIMTRIRTMWGLDMTELGLKYGDETAKDVLESAKPYVETGDLIKDNELLKLSASGKLLADAVCAALFL